MADIPSEIVERTLVVYSEYFRSTKFTGTLALSEWYSLFPDEFPKNPTPYKWPDHYPNRGKPGVYFFFDSGMSLLYVGRCEHDIQSRLGDHVTWANNRFGPCKIIEKKKGKPWRVRPCYVKTVAVQESSEAPLLESFLIDKLQPPENDKGRRK
jgi:hypothetical protein